MMNAMGDHSMATRKAFVPFDDLRPELDELVSGDWSELESFPNWARCRILAMRPGGPVARLMAAHAVCMKVRVFAHRRLFSPRRALCGKCHITAVSLVDLHRAFSVWCSPDCELVACLTWVRMDPTVV